MGGSPHALAEHRRSRWLGHFKSNLTAADGTIVAAQRQRAKAQRLTRLVPGLVGRKERGGQRVFRKVELDPGAFAAIRQPCDDLPRAFRELGGQLRFCEPLTAGVGSTLRERPLRLAYGEEQLDAFIRKPGSGREIASMDPEVDLPSRKPRRGAIHCENGHDTRLAAEWTAQRREEPGAEGDEADRNQTPKPAIQPRQVPLHRTWPHDPASCTRRDVARNRSSRRSGRLDAWHEAAGREGSCWMPWAYAWST